MVNTQGAGILPAFFEELNESVAMGVHSELCIAHGYHIFCAVLTNSYCIMLYSWLWWFGYNQTIDIRESRGNIS
jgi:hypothetical protein